MGLEPQPAHQPWPSAMFLPSGRGRRVNTGPLAMITRLWSAGDAPASTSSWLGGRGGSRGRDPRAPVALGGRAQQAAPGHRRSYKRLGRVHKRANPCSHRSGFVPAPEPSLTINRGWVSSKVCSICCLLLENRSLFRIQESARKAGIFVNTIMVILTR